MKSLLDKINIKLNAQGGFLKSVSVLVGGTAFAQLIAMICLPILTRLYTPQEYSILGVYVAIVSILAVISCLRLEIAIPISKCEKEAKSLLILSILINLFFLLILYFILYFIYPFIKNNEVVIKLSNWIWLVPIGVFLCGLYSAFQFWALRKKRFKDIAQTRVTQAIFGNFSTMFIGFNYGGFGGLILGQILSFFGGILKLGKSTFNDIHQQNHENFKKTFIKFKKFPQYSTVEALANVSGIQLPLIIISIFLFGSDVGYLMLAMKILGIPMGLIGSAMSQVYLSKASEVHGAGDLYLYTKNIVYKILKITILPFLLLAILSPYIFVFIFGENWKDLGYYVLGMIPSYFMQILYSPISMSLHIINFQKIALLIQIIGFLLRVVGLLVILFLCKKWAIPYYIVASFIFYVICLFSTLWCIKIRNENKLDV